MDPNSDEFKKIKSVIQVAELLRTDPKKAVLYIRKYRECYRWISDEQLNAIEKEQKE